MAVDEEVGGHGCNDVECPDLREFQSRQLGSLGRRTRLRVGRCLDPLIAKETRRFINYFVVACPIGFPPRTQSSPGPSEDAQVGMFGPRERFFNDDNGREG